MYKIDWLELKLIYVQKFHVSMERRQAGELLSFSSLPTVVLLTDDYEVC